MAAIVNNHAAELGRIQSSMQHAPGAGSGGGGDVDNSISIGTQTVFGNLLKTGPIFNNTTFSQCSLGTLGLNSLHDPTANSIFKKVFQDLQDDKTFGFGLGGEEGAPPPQPFEHALEGISRDMGMPQHMSNALLAQLSPSPTPGLGNAQNISR